MLPCQKQVHVRKKGGQTQSIGSWTLVCIILTCVPGAWNSVPLTHKLNVFMGLFFHLLIPRPSQVTGLASISMTSTASLSMSDFLTPKFTLRAFPGPYQKSQASLQIFTFLGLPHHILLK